MRILFLLALAGTALACGDPTAPALLIGSWTSPTRDIGAGYSHAEDLTFQPDGILRSRIRIYRDGRLESTYDATYTYLVRNDSLFTWSAERGPDVLSYIGSRFDRARFSVNARTLTIIYPWFGPADEPITVTEAFLRRAAWRW